MPDRKPHKPKPRAPQPREPKPQPDQPEPKPPPPSPTLSGQRLAALVAAPGVLALIGVAWLAARTTDLESRLGPASTTDPNSSAASDSGPTTTDPATTAPAGAHAAQPRSTSAAPGSPVNETTPAETAYRLAYEADHRGDYNAAREGYLKALTLDPSLAAARYNLAVLTWRHGARDEATNHIDTFIRDYPHDPRGPELKRALQADAR